MAPRPDGCSDRTSGRLRTRTAADPRNRHPRSDQAARKRIATQKGPPDEQPALIVGPLDYRRNKPNKVIAHVIERVPAGSAAAATLSPEIPRRTPGNRWPDLHRVFVTPPTFCLSGDQKKRRLRRGTGDCVVHSDLAQVRALLCILVRYEDRWMGSLDFAIACLPQIRASPSKSASAWRQRPLGGAALPITQAANCHGPSRFWCCPVLDEDRNRQRYRRAGDDCCRLSPRAAFQVVECGAIHHRFRTVGFAGVSRPPCPSPAAPPKILSGIWLGSISAALWRLSVRNCTRPQKARLAWWPRDCADRRAAK